MLCRCLEDRHMRQRIAVQAAIAQQWAQSIAQQMDLCPDGRAYLLTLLVSSMSEALDHPFCLEEYTSRIAAIRTISTAGADA